MKHRPTNPQLYQQVIREAKTKFLVWPSAYASGWVVKTYKARGGTYETLPSKQGQSQERPLARWYKENWVNVCAFAEKGVLEPCGRQKATWTRYPYCRPEKRITPNTPMTLSEMMDKYGKQEIIRRCRQKRRDPQTRVR